MVIGVGAGAGVVAYTQGELKIQYDSEYHTTVDTTIDTLNDLKIKIADQIGDELKTTIHAARPDGTPIRVNIVRIDSGSTEVGIRTGEVGLRDREVSQQIHDFIAERLIHPEKKTAAATDSQSSEYSTEPFQQPPADDTTKSILEKDIAPAPSKSKSDGEVDLKENTYDSNQLVSKLSETEDFTLFFSKDSDELSKKHMEKLDRLSGLIHENPTAAVKIKSYHYSSSGTSYNKMISYSQGNLIKTYLMGKGISPELIEVKGQGAGDSTAGSAEKPNGEIRGRVEIEIYTFKRNQ